MFSIPRSNTYPPRVLPLTPNPRAARLALAALVAALFLAAAVPLILFAGPLDRPGFDQLNFHEPAIRIFAHDWAHRASGMNFATYLSATTPAYHVALAAVARFLSDSTIALQLAGSLFTAALLALLTYLNSERAPLRLVFATSLAVLASRYVFFPGVWLLPDNAGWLCVLSILALAFRRQTDLLTIILGSALLALTVLTRQTHIWVAAPLFLAALWPAPPNLHDPAPLARPISEPPILSQRFLWSIAACVPAFIILRTFYDLWHGLTPPLFQYQYPNASQGLEKLNLAAPAFLLAILGLYSPFFAPSWLPAFLRLCRSHKNVVALAFALALPLVLIPNTTYSPDQSHGRWEGLWSIANHAPNLFHHTSTLILALALLATAALLGFFARLPLRDAALTLTTLAAFSSTQAVAFQLWQRYHEPLALILLALLACRVASNPSGETGVWGEASSKSPTPRTYFSSFSLFTFRFSLFFAALALALLLAAITATKLARSKPDHKLSPDQLMSELFPNAPKSLTPRMAP